MLSENAKNEDHQAAKLKKLFEEIRQDEPDESTSSYEDFFSLEQQVGSRTKIDILNLPPRSEVHGNKTKKFRFKLEIPFIRLFIVILLLILIVSGGYYLWGTDWVLFTML